ncbi:MAG: hypothetical protein GYB67_17725 [Chloroflexi bacterium]|nr:hypothetical protein [Chloroflexota bacterium]
MFQTQGVTRRAGRLALIVLVLLLALTAGVSAQDVPDGSTTGADAQPNVVVGSLTSSAITASGNINATAAGVGLRGTGTGDIVLNTIPAGATVQNAFLYWATIGTTDGFANVTLNGNAVMGNNIGTAGETCWTDNAAEANFVYFADVTALVAGNGTYTIAGLPNSGPEVNDSQGASLVVVYAQAGLPNRLILVNHGAVTLSDVGDSFVDTFTGFVPDSPLTSAVLWTLVGDGQTFSEGDQLINGQVFATDPFDGGDGDWWDTDTFDVTAFNPSDPTNVTFNTADDCLLIAANILEITGQEPTATPSITPTATPTNTPPATVTATATATATATMAATSTATATSTAMPLPMGDGVGIYDPARALWLLRNTLTTGEAEIAFVFGGLAGGLAVTGDWNGDGVDTPGIFVPATGAWYIRNSNTSGLSDAAFVFGGGIPGAMPFAGDWNGDGMETPGLYNPNNGMWLLRNSLTSGIADVSFTFAESGFNPVVGDWDGDGVTTPGLHNQATAQWLLRNSNSAGSADVSLLYGGVTNSTPLGGDWDNDGVDTVGITITNLAYWDLRNSNTTGIGEVFLVYGGIFNAQPVTGRWGTPMVTAPLLQQNEIAAPGELPQLAPPPAELQLPAAPADPNTDGNLGGELPQ